jgi:tRNA threonylcarbamoyladenosine biosynthesis protein TsaE
MKFRSTSTHETQKIAFEFVAELRPHTTEATIVALQGDLGSGKTTFTQFVANTLHFEGAVTSPTFVIEKIYKLNNNQYFNHLIHIDAYRLESAHELETLGWKELTSDPKNLILIEWPEKVAEILPENIKKVHFKFIDETTRDIEITG